VALKIIEIQEQSDSFSCRLGHTFDHFIYGYLNFIFLILMLLSFVLSLVISGSVQFTHTFYLFTWFIQLLIFLKTKENKLVLDRCSNKITLYRINFFNRKTKIFEIFFWQAACFGWSEEQERMGFQTGIPSLVLKTGDRLGIFDRVFEHEMKSLKIRLDTYLDSS